MIGTLPTVCHADGMTRIRFAQTCHWDLMQVKYATDLVFRAATAPGPLYEQLTRQSVLSVKAEQIATFPGGQMTAQPGQEIGSQFSTRIERTCIKHRFRHAPITMYDKFGQILRIETTTNDVSFFKHHRKVTSERPSHPRSRPGQEDRLLPDRPARDTVRLQPPISGASVCSRRLPGQRSRARPAHKAAPVCWRCVTRSRRPDSHGGGLPCDPERSHSGSDLMEFFDAQNVTS